MRGVRGEALGTADNRRRDAGPRISYPEQKSAGSLIYPGIQFSCPVTAFAVYGGCRMAALFRVGGGLLWPRAALNVCRVSVYVYLYTCICIYIYRERVSER